MNLLLLEKSDLVDTTTAVIHDGRVTHIHNVLGSKTGDTLTVGMLDGLCGKATITSLQHNEATLAFHLDQAPPKALPLTVILALPRPKMLRRIIKNIAEFGIKELYLIHSYKVDKSYWQTPFLETSAIQAFLKEGLMQSKDTIMPNVHIKKRFKPFVEDELAQIIGTREAFVAHPYNADTMPQPSSKERVVIIGPEGGFIDYEIELLKKQGAKPVSMGERIYRVENAVTLLSKQLSQ